MKIQLRPSLLKVRRQSVKWIVIHHTVELYPQPAARIDNATYQLPELYKGVLEDKSGDINYHYVIEKVKEDYQAFVTRPFVYLCEWDDIDDVYDLIRYYSRNKEQEKIFSTIEFLKQNKSLLSQWL